VHSCILWNTTERLLFPIATLTDIARNSLVVQNMLKKNKIRVTVFDYAVGLTIAASPSVAAHSFTHLNGVYY
jgi:hypothetical protein